MRILGTPVQPRRQPATASRPRLLIGRARRQQSNEKAVPIREVAEATVDAKRNQHTTVSFVYRFPEPGDYVIQLQIPGDALTLDDQRTAVIRVRNTVPVLVVNGKTDVNAFDRASEFLRVALDPTKEGEHDIPASLAASAARPANAAGSSPTPATSDLTNYDGIFLCDVDLPSAPTRPSRSRPTIRRGGDRDPLYWRRDQVDVNSIQRHAGVSQRRGLMPAKLLDKVQRRPGRVALLGINWPMDARGRPTKIRCKIFAGLAGPRTTADAALHRPSSARSRPRPATGVCAAQPGVVLRPRLEQGQAGAARDADTRLPAAARPSGKWRPPLPGRSATASRTEGGHCRSPRGTSTFERGWY